MRQLPYEIASKIVPRPKAGEAYAEGLIQKYADMFLFWVTLTPRVLHPTRTPRRDSRIQGQRKDVSVATLYKWGRQLCHSLNVLCFGRGYAGRGEGLLCVFMVEDHKPNGNRVPVHIHLLIQDHPKLTVSVIISTWLQISKGAIEVAQDVRLLHSLSEREACIHYMLKCVEWTHERRPFTFVPKHLIKDIESPLDISLNKRYTSGVHLQPVTN